MYIIYALGGHLNQKFISQDFQGYINGNHSTLFWRYWKIYHLVYLHVAVQISWIKCGSPVPDIGGSSLWLLSIRESKRWTTQASLFSRTKKKNMVGSKDVIDDYGSRKSVSKYREHRFLHNIKLTGWTWDPTAPRFPYWWYCSHSHVIDIDAESPSDRVPLVNIVWSLGAYVYFGFLQWNKVFILYIIVHHTLWPTRMSKNSDVVYWLLC